MVKNEDTKANRLLKAFPSQHPVSKLYAEIRDKDLLALLEFSKEKFEKANIDNNYLSKIEDDEDINALSRKLIF